MDEISYWIYTKRAPCLMNYDNVIKKQHEEAQCSKNDKSVYEIVSPPPKRKKKQLSILDDNSVSTEKQHNLYFEVSQKQNKPVLNVESDSLGSDVEFNIKNASFQNKRKKARNQKSRQILQKRNKVVTSTPKQAVRRSLRQAQLHNNTHLNSSFETFHANIVNGVQLKNNIQNQPKDPEPVTRSPLILTEENNDKNQKVDCLRNKSKTAVIQNGHFEDVSDVSGFTANYIRSTKVQSNKTPRKLRCKNNRSLVKQAQDDSNMVVCVNKSTNTEMVKDNNLNCSTDSSQNILNLVTLKNCKPVQIDRTTSQLKFMDKKSKSKESLVKDKPKPKCNKLNITFQSRSSVSRYPIRNKQHNNVTDNGLSTPTTPRKKRATKNYTLEFNNSDKKENPDDKVVTRTRSGRNGGLTVSHRENSILVVSNSTEQMSTVVSMNVASPKNSSQKKRKCTRQTRNRKSANKTEQLKVDSLRDKSGFAACFSDSDNDSEPLKHKKYFGS